MAEESLVGKQGDEAITTEKAKAAFNSENVSIRDGAEDAATAADGTKLHPRPTSDALDPLNWSTTTKHVILGIVMLKYVQIPCHSAAAASSSHCLLYTRRLTNFFARYFLFTYITTTTVPSFPEIQEQFSVTLSQVNWTVAIPALGLSVGPLFWSSLSDIYGRRIIFIVGTTISLVSTCGAAVADSYGGYMAARFFQGFGVSPAATVGMAVGEFPLAPFDNSDADLYSVGDLFFEHERGTKLGLWVLALDTGLLAGPICKFDSCRRDETPHIHQEFMADSVPVGGFLNEVSSAWINWFNAILFAALLVLELFFMPETLYPRNMMLRNMHSVPGSPGPDVEKAGNGTFGGVTADIPRTKEIFFLNFKPIPGLRHPRPWSTIVRFFLSFQQAPVVIAVLGYCYVWYWWVLSVITMIPVSYAQYSPLIQGLLFIGLLLGTLFSEVFCSGRLSDWIVANLARKNGGTRVAEMRLWLVYPALLITAGKTPQFRPDAQTYTRVLTYR